MIEDLINEFPGIGGNFPTCEFCENKGYKKRLVKSVESPKDEEFPPSKDMWLCEEHFTDWEEGMGIFDRLP